MQPILKVDLSSGEIVPFDVPASWQMDYLGGASLAARMLFEHLTPQLDALSPEAPLLWMNGPLTGTSGPAVGRFVVCAKSPATGLWGESNCGGFWGPELRMAGYDGLWIVGKAAEPVYLWIQDQKVEIRPASKHWGKDTYTTQENIAAELHADKPRIAVIGPAGERLIPFSLILTDHGRVAGRTGMGAVMGSKNLKAVAVQGSGKAPLFDPDRYQSIRSDANRELKSDAVSVVLRELGSSSAAEYFDYLGEMPKRYFREAYFEEPIQVSGSRVRETILAGISACHACVIACGRVVRLEDGAKRKGPEYETMVGFGPNLMLNNLDFVTRMGEQCDRYGMDSISLSNTIGLAFHLYEQGVIRPEHTGGLVLEWGSSDAVEQLVHMAARREGIGEYLALGARGLGRHFRAEQEAVHVKGLEVAYHDPRGVSGMALVYATSPVGASHNQGDYFLVDIGQADEELGMKLYDRQGGEEKAPNVALHQNWVTLSNALVLCIFANVPPAAVRGLVNAAVGVDWTLEDMLRCGERGWNLKHLINIRLGLRREDDQLPRRLLTPFCNNNQGTSGYVPDLESMLAAYYKARGWDIRTGVPSLEKLQSLGLEWAHGN